MVSSPSVPSPPHPHVLLALCDAPESWTGAEVLRGFAPLRRRLENAGHAFFDEYEAESDDDSDDYDSSDEQQTRYGSGRTKAGGTKDGDNRSANARRRGKKKGAGGGDKRGGEKIDKTGATLKIPKTLVGWNLYEVLDVAEGASAEELKKCYRKQALIHHPDKKEGAADGTDGNAPKTERSSGSWLGGMFGGSGGGKKKKKKASTQEEQFLRIQGAYEILSDAAMRRKYDSSLPFDDSIPKEADLIAADDAAPPPGEADPAVAAPDAAAPDAAPAETDPAAVHFFRTLTPVFERNARWSTQKPVLPLGALTDSEEQVTKFYEFWHRFASWREFMHEDEVDLDEAESREERRFLEKENLRLRKEAESAERRRIQKLVQLAEAHDPRLKLFNRQKKVKRENEKRERDERRRELEKEKEAEVAAKREAEAAAERLEKERKKALREKAKKLRQRLRRGCGLVFNGFGVGGSGAGATRWTEVAVGDLAIGLSEKDENLPILEELVADVEGLEAGKTAVETLVVLLDRAQKVVDAQQLAARLEKEEAEKKLEVKWKKQEELERKKQLQARIWEEAEILALTKAIVRYPGGAINRWENIQALLVQSGFKQRDTQQIIHKTRELQGKIVQSNPSNDKDAYSAYLEKNQRLKETGQTDGNAAGAAKPVGVAAVAGGTSTKGLTATDAKANAGAPSTATNAAAPTDDDAWTPVQQKQLEAALRKHPATLSANERWTLIAGDVEGKTKKQCAARFKALREQALKK